MINAKDGCSGGKKLIPIDTRAVEYAALKGVCRDYLDGKVTDKDLYLFHVGMLLDSNRQETWFGDHPVFKLLYMIHRHFADEMFFARCDKNPTFHDLVEMRDDWKMELRKLIGNYGIQHFQFPQTGSDQVIVQGETVIYNN